MNGGEPPVDTATFEPSSENPISLPEPQAAPPNPEELVAKAIAPVKAEFLRPPPSRSRSDGADEKNSVSSNVVKEKKSKRQLKRERQQVSFQNFHSACCFQERVRDDLGVLFGFLSSNL